MFNCRFCKTEITRDRYNLAVEGTRQDFPPEGEMQRLVEIPLENVCASCFGELISGFKSVVLYLTERKKRK